VVTAVSWVCGSGLAEADLREEREEDDREAVLTRLKRRQFVPDFVLKAPRLREKPTMVCIARDVPHHIKDHVLGELATDPLSFFHSLNWVVVLADELQTKYFPSRFFDVIDSEADMGLNLIEMQRVLSNKQSIIIFADFGLCRVSRTSFVHTLELCVRSLVPIPNVVCICADERNMRMGFGDAHYGVSKHDLQV
jgi:hypothetical protein